MQVITIITLLHFNHLKKAQFWFNLAFSHAATANVFPLSFTVVHTRIVNSLRSVTTLGVLLSYKLYYIHCTEVESEAVEYKHEYFNAD